MIDTIDKKDRKLQRHAKLGFQNLEASKVVNGLNMLLANYAIHYQKLRNFHWNVEGPDFFDIHEKFEEQYNFTKETIDTIAERIRVFGKKPLSTLRDYLDISDINEVDSDFKSSMMVSEILNDFEIILTHLTEVYDTAAEIGDVGTTHMIEKFISRLEKKYWMFASFNKSQV